MPFYHAGVDLLRSKSIDRNSYNSGDWFNRLDFTRESNNWGVGLPPAGDNEANWPVMRPLLADPALAPTGAEIQDAFVHLQESLALVAAGALSGGQGRALLSKLEAARKHLSRGDLAPARGELGAFVRQVEDFAAEGVLTPEQADALLAEARAILGLIGG